MNILIEIFHTLLTLHMLLVVAVGLAGLWLVVNVLEIGIGLAVLWWRGEELPPSPLTSEASSRRSE